MWLPFIRHCCCCCCSAAAVHLPHPSAGLDVNTISTISIDDGVEERNAEKEPHKQHRIEQLGIIETRMGNNLLYRVSHCKAATFFIPRERNPNLFLIRAPRPRA